MNTIPVRIPAVPQSTYDVRIAPNLLASLGQTVRAIAPAPSCALISDSNVAPLYLSSATASLTNAGYRVIQHIMPAGEQHKTLRSVSDAVDTILAPQAGGIERATPVIALGGGVVGDLGGFVAATLLRGLPFIQVPTTLLAAVDASIGGKVGVDHATGKNLLGAFHQPKVVITDISTFSTLPPRELRGGLAECIKHAVIRDPALFAFIADNVPKIMACDPEALAHLVAANVAIKAAIVHEDPFEKSVRALLNFGHTFGHAIENVLHYSGLAHGEAVALGMIAAGRLSVALGGKDAFPAQDFKKLITLIDYVGLPIYCVELDVDMTLAAMMADKKVRAGKLRFVLPTRIGDARIVTDVPPEPVRAALASLRQPVLDEKCGSG